MYKFFRPLFFLFTPEMMHRFVGAMMRMVYLVPPLRKLICKWYSVKNPALEREFCGMKFANPVGLAAGFDKNATLFKAFSMLGFSFIEVGTVTPKPQKGNKKPRLFRIVSDNALINRMGFNNNGVDAAVKRLKRKFPNIVIGGNIGKNTQTPNDHAAADYLECFRRLYDYVDYFTLNVSCPNVANLSELQNLDALQTIMVAILAERNRHKHRKPVLLKISPDVTHEHLEDIITFVEESDIDGIVAVNTTVERNSLTVDSQKLNMIGNGGLSGAPLAQKAIDTVRFISQRTKGRLPVIGAGGIMKPADAINMLNAGATLVQVYTGMIYEGPLLVKKINEAILRAQTK
jgi:dihydroorotate dehydrogenase